MIEERVRWIPLNDPRVSRLEEGAILRVVLRGRGLCLVRHAGGLHALADVCPHQGKRLSGGWMDQGYLVCPWHRFHFDPTTGRARHGVCANAEVFPVRMEGDGVQVGFPYTTLRVFGIDLW